jgi:hypothetical protein
MQEHRHNTVLIQTVQTPSCSLMMIPWQTSWRKFKWTAITPLVETDQGIYLHESQEENLREEIDQNKRRVERERERAARESAESDRVTLSLSGTSEFQVQKQYQWLP